MLWGDPTKAPRVILCEGIETAAALARTYQTEIEAGEITIAAALSTSGIRAFVPWPATRSVTIAADRDENKLEDDRGFRAGERAARAFALAHHERLEVRIALPGDPGEDIDWLDVLRRAGAEAVRAGINSAERVVPTQYEIEDARQAAERASTIAKIEAAYPLPLMETMTLSYQHTRSGRILVHKYGRKDKEGSETWLPVATPFGVPAQLRYADQQGTYGLRAIVQSMDGHPLPVDFDRASLARMGATDIRAHLFAAGLRVEGDGEVVAVQALKAADPPWR